ncbi:hypothetical protein CAPTEDRAFT_226689 [Capitella teleta]|uniref:Ribosome biogenesis protein SLX9 n=2 Tax=Capitella teleta TaxID=283909 RepID=R7U266_CAPTE|nr:hypothetical protein CAPTEDRAFT_226689 [Capitella teleta]|eukprot:ELT97756.1 hypothetical protein CAPTEDRAFT_226689 [Capitella teleta]
MGKLRKKALKKKAATDGGGSAMDTDVPSLAITGGQGSLEGGLFSKLDVDLNALKRQLAGGGGEDDDAKTAITSKSFRGLNIKKKEKMKIKKEFWGKKMDLIKSVHKEEVDRKKRRQTAVVGDMKPLSDALPTLELLMKQGKEVKNPLPGKPKPIKKEKSRQKDMLHDMKMFQLVVNHPAYKASALSTIKTHLRNKLEEEAKS